MTDMLTTVRQRALRRWRRPLVALVLVALASIAFGAMSASADRGGASNRAGATSDNAGNTLAGTWTVAVNRPAPQPPLTSLQVYTGEGRMVESGSESMSRSPQYASWERVRGREYVATGLFFRFDPQTGAFLGRQKINRTIALAQDGESLTLRGRGPTNDANGNVVVANVPVSGSGQRLQVEQQS